jgi:hypothetical protein
MLKKKKAFKTELKKTTIINASLSNGEIFMKEKLRK